MDQKTLVFLLIACLLCVSSSAALTMMLTSGEDETTSEDENTSGSVPATVSVPSTVSDPSSNITRISQMAKVLDSDCSGSWGDWGDCTQGCSYEGSKGEKVRMYSVKSEATGEGKACPYDDGEEEVQECGKIACTPTDCVGNWTAWSVEGVGANAIEKRSWDVTQEPKYGGAECSVEESARMETKAATTSTPSVDCVGSWVNVGMCSETCGPDGKQKRRYDVTTAASGPDGKSCTNSAGLLLKDGDIDNTQPCNTDIVCPVDCAGSYGNWSSCSETCDGGTRRRTYSVTTPAAGTGTACPFDDGHVEDGVCNENPCNVDCEGYWKEDPSGRSQSKKGSNYRTMKYVVTQAKSGTGKDCMWAFARESPKVGATDVPRRPEGWIKNRDDKWSSEVVTDGQKGEHFNYWENKGGGMDAASNSKTVKYCMRHPNINRTENIEEKGYINTAAYGRENVWVVCDEES